LALLSPQPLGEGEKDGKGEGGGVGRIGTAYLFIHLEREITKTILFVFREKRKRGKPAVIDKVTTNFFSETGIADHCPISDFTQGEKGEGKKKGGEGKEDPLVPTFCAGPVTRHDAARWDSQAREKERRKKRGGGKLKKAKGGSSLPTALRVRCSALAYDVR